MAQVLRDPDALFATVQQHRSALDVQRVDAAAEVAELRQTLARIQRQRRRLLDLYLNEEVAKATLLARDAEFAAA